MTGFTTTKLKSGILWCSPVSNQLIILTGSSESFVCISPTTQYARGAFVVYNTTLNPHAVLYILFFGLRLPKERKVLLGLLLYGFLTSTVSLGLLFFGLENTTVLDMSLITLFGPLLITIAGVFLLNEKVTLRERVGIAIAFAGTVFTVVEPILNGDGARQISGNIFIFLYLAVNTMAVVLAKKLLRNNVKPIYMSHTSFVMGFLTIAPLSLLIYSPEGMFDIYTTLPPQYHLGVVFMALLSGNLAYTLWNRAQRSIEISEASLFAYLYPLFAAPLAVFWLGEKITYTFFVGAVIIAAGVIIAEYKKAPRKPD